MTEVFMLETLLKEVQLLKFRVEQLEDENKKIPHLEAEIINLKKENEHLKERLLTHFAAELR